MIQARNIDADIFGFGNYSTSEVNTGFTWIDGKPIYKKTIVVNSITAETDMNIPHNISNFGNCIRIEGVGFLSAGSRVFSGGTSTNRWTFSNITSTYFSIYSTLGTAGTYYFTLYYTKTN